MVSKKRTRGRKTARNKCATSSPLSPTNVTNGNPSYDSDAIPALLWLAIEESMFGSSNMSLKTEECCERRLLWTLKRNESVARTDISVRIPKEIIWPGCPSTKHRVAHRRPMVVLRQTNRSTRLGKHRDRVAVARVTSRPTDGFCRVEPPFEQHIWLQNALEGPPANAKTTMSFTDNVHGLPQTTTCHIVCSCPRLLGRRVATSDPTRAMRIKQNGVEETIYFSWLLRSSSEERMYDVRKKLDGDKKAKAEKVVEGELAPCNTT